MTGPQWEDCKVCGGDHWTKDHDHRYPPERQMSQRAETDAMGEVERAYLRGNDEGYRRGYRHGLRDAAALGDRAAEEGR